MDERAVAMGAITLNSNQTEPQLAKVDSRNRIRLGNEAEGLYRITQTDFGYTLEQVEVVSKRDRRIRENKQLWKEASKAVREDNFEPLDLDALDQ